MADASPTYRRGLAQPGVPGLEKYLGLIGAGAAILGAFAIFGSVETLRFYTEEVLDSLYLLIGFVAS